MAAEAALDAGLRTFDELREQVRTADERSVTIREAFTAHESRIREARRLVESVRAEAARFDVARATAEADLTHVAEACLEAVQATIEAVSAEIEELERTGALASPKPVDDAPDAAEVDEEGAAVSSDAAPAESAPAPARGR